MGTLVSQNVIHITTTKSMKDEIVTITNHWIRIHVKLFPDVLIQLMVNYAYRPLTKDPLNKITIRDNIFKLVICGDPFVGKTCIVEKYVNPINDHHHQYNSNDSNRYDSNHPNLTTNQLAGPNVDNDLSIPYNASVNSSEEMKFDHNQIYHNISDTDEIIIEHKANDDNAIVSSWNSEDESDDEKYNVSTRQTREEDGQDWEYRLYEYPDKVNPFHCRWDGVKHYDTQRSMLKYECTVGCDIYEKEIEIMNEMKYELHIWDIGGNSVFTNIESFFKNADGVC